MKTANAAVDRQLAAHRHPSASGDLVVRDTFSMLPWEYELIERIRIRVAREGHIYSKSEVIRAALLALESLHLEDMVHKFYAVEKIKPGRKV